MIGRDLPKPDGPSGRATGPLTFCLVALLLAASTLPVFAVADLPGEADGTVAAVFAPTTGKAAALAAVAEAGGSVLRAGAWRSVLIVRSDKAGFAGRLRRAGAILVVDPQSAAGCLLAGATEQSS